MKLWRKKDTVAIFILILIAIFIYWSINSYYTNGFMKNLFEGNSEALSEQILSYGNFSYFIFFIIIIIECVFAPLPALAIYVVGGTIFGGSIAGCIATLANIIGAGIAFKISHYYGKEKLAPKIPKEIKKRFSKSSKRYGPLGIFILRINPLTSSDLFSYLAGLTEMDFKKFIIATAAGLTPIIFLQTYLGEQIQSNPIINKISMIFTSLYLLAFVIGYIWAKRKFKIHIDLHNKRKGKKLFSSKI